MYTYRLATLLTFGASLFSCVSSRLEFINPPPFGTEGDFSSNPIYTEDSTINIAWKKGAKERAASLVLYQLNETDGVFFGEMEYLTLIAFSIEHCVFGPY